MGTAARAPHTQRKRGAAALGLLTVASITLSVLGISTGDGPLGPPFGYGVGYSRDVGEAVTDGNTMLTNHGLFTAHIESIRVLPVGDASAGMSITAVELVPTSHPLIGTVDDAGYEYASAGVRSRPAGYTILPSRLAGRPGSAELLVRSEVTQPGEWRYRGYEVVYRSGFVRHRMVVEAELQACTPAGGGCLDQLP